MTIQAWWQQPAAAVSESFRQQALERQNQLTKPPGSLRPAGAGCRAAGGTLQQRVKPAVQNPQLVVFAGDHGVVAQGVSAFPQAVTVAMLSNFVAGGAAVAVLARLHGIGLNVVNCGTVTPCEHLAGVIQCPVMPGTQDFFSAGRHEPGAGTTGVTHWCRTGRAPARRRV